MCRSGFLIIYLLGVILNLETNVLLQVKHDPLYVFFRAQTSALLGWTELAELLIASGPYALCSTKVDIN